MNKLLRLAAEFSRTKMSSFQYIPSSAGRRSSRLHNDVAAETLLFLDVTDNFHSMFNNHVIINLVHSGNYT